MTCQHKRFQAYDGFALCLECNGSVPSPRRRPGGRPRISAALTVPRSVYLTPDDWKALRALAVARTRKDGPKVTSSALARDAILRLLKDSGFVTS